MLFSNIDEYLCDSVVGWKNTGLVEGVLESSWNFCSIGFVSIKLLMGKVGRVKISMRILEFFLSPYPIAMSVPYHISPCLHWQTFISIAVYLTRQSVSLVFVRFD